MIEVAKSGNIDLILTKSISRFSRNVVDCISILSDLKSHNVEVFFENEKISSFDPKIEFILSILAGIAEEEAHSVSENVKWGVKKRFQEGNFHIVTKRMLGYDQDRNGHLIINESEATTVRKIFDMYTSNILTHIISKYLYELNIKTSLGRDKWNNNKIMGIIKNEKYTGNALLQKTTRPSYRLKTRIKNDNILPMYYVENSHPAIISQEQFDLAQEIRLTRIKKYHKEVNHANLRRKFATKTIYAYYFKYAHCGKYFHKKIVRKNTASENHILSCHSNFGKKTCSTDSMCVSVINRIIINLFKDVQNNIKSFLNTARVAYESHPKGISLEKETKQTRAKIDARVTKLKALNETHELDSLAINQIKKDIETYQLKISNFELFNMRRLHLIC